jgi:hypothetical protein
MKLKCKVYRKYSMSDTPKFDPALIAMIRKRLAHTLAEEIVGVQPMSGPPLIRFEETEERIEGWCVWSEDHSEWVDADYTTGQIRYRPNASDATFFESRTDLISAIQTHDNRGQQRYIVIAFEVVMQKLTPIYENSEPSTGSIYNYRYNLEKSRTWMVDKIPINYTAF